MWIVFALLAALSAAIVTVLSKAGLKNIDSSLAFAIESVLIIIVSWAVVLFQKSTVELSKVTGKEWWLLITAGIITALSSLFTFRASSQTSVKKLTGKVIDENGNAMPGVSITVSGSSVGTSTDSSGNFSINAPSRNGVLTFSSVSYLSREGKIGNS